MLSDFVTSVKRIVKSFESVSVRIQSYIKRIEDLHQPIWIRGAIGFFSNTIWKMQFLAGLQQRLEIRFVGFQRTILAAWAVFDNFKEHQWHKKICDKDVFTTFILSESSKQKLRGLFDEFGEIVK